MQHYSSTCNEERYDLYYDMFTDLLRGHHDGDARIETIRANLMIDIRWPEVSRALSDVVCHLCGTLRQNCYAPLAYDIGRLMERAATIAFGTSRHAEIPSWFLQNNECLLAATLHKMLVEFVTSGEFIVRYTDSMMHKAFCVLLDIAEGMRNCLGLSYLADSTGAHALMSAVTNSKYDFLSKDAQILHRSERIFASVLAERIMADPNRAMELRSGFCFFVRSRRWREFASVCLDRDGLGTPLAQLLAEVHLATKRLAEAEACRPRSPASLLPQNVSSPDRPIRRTRMRTPTKLPRSAIAKPARRIISPPC